MKVTEKKLADGVIKLDCEATAIEVNNALKEAAEAFAMQMGVRPAPGKSIEELAKEQLGIADLDKIVEPNAIEVLVPRALDRRNLVPAFPPKATPTVKFERGKKFTFTLNVTVKPTYELTSYEPVEITVPPFTFDETPINQQLEEIAKNSVTYVVADAKPLTAGDACSIAMKCFDDGEEIKALTCEDRTYLMGRGYMPEGFDEALIGMEPGQTKEFTFEAPLGTENGEVVNKPISCTVTTEEVFQDFIADPSDRDSYFRDISTFGGCTAGPAAGYANINYMEEHNVLDNVVKMGDYLMDGLKALEKKYEIIGDVRGKGLFCGLELVKNRTTKEPVSEAVAGAVVGECMKQGVIIGKTSRCFRELNNTLCLAPALIATTAEIDEILKALDNAFQVVKA